MERHLYQQHTDDESEKKTTTKKTTVRNPTILPLYHNKFAQPYLSEERLGFLCASASEIKLNQSKTKNLTISALEFEKW